MDIATDLDFSAGAVGRISRPAFVAANGGSLNIRHEADLPRIVSLR
jgi:hypothetical protein